MNLEAATEYGVTGTPALEETTASEAYDKPLKGIHVLLAEDLPDNQVLIQQYLKLAGASVEIAVNGAEAVQKASNQNFHVVLMDVMMPIQDGYEATRELRSQGFDKPIIILTAYALRGEKERALAEGCNDHLSKPINRRLLVSTVAKFASKT